MIDRAIFYAGARRELGKLRQSQVDGFERILDEAERRAVILPQLAYILATVWHETAKRMQPVREMGGEAYLRRKPYYPWVGEGLVQVTWEYNARKFGAKKPGDLMSWPIALRALFDGMGRGMFTGKRLDDYIAPPKVDFINARRIVNGLDKADLVAAHAERFRALLANAVAPRQKRGKDGRGRRRRPTS